MTFALVPQFNYTVVKGNMWCYHIGLRNVLCHEHILYEDVGGDKDGINGANILQVGDWSHVVPGWGKEKKGIGNHIFWKKIYSTVFYVMITETYFMTNHEMPTHRMDVRHDKEMKI